MCPTQHSVLSTQSFSLRHTSKCFLHHRRCVLVKSHSLKRRLLQHSAFWPAAELDLYDEVRLAPAHAAARELVGEGTAVGLQRTQLLQQRARRRIREPAADAAGVAELSFGVVVADLQRSEPAFHVFLVGPPADDELLPQDQL